MKNAVAFYYLLLICISASAQNTIGLIDISPSQISPGYNLIYPENQENVYLLDVCGRIINVWTDTISRPGKTAYLTKEGNLLKAKTSGFLYSNSFGTGGAGGVVELRSWNNDIIWQYIVADSLIRQHHDVLMMPNGNVMMIVWEKKSLENILQNGFDTIALPQREIWSDKIIEVNPSTNQIVWEWHAWDHMIQDVNSASLNYGVVENHPERIDINYHQYSFGRQDWMHTNSIDYNEELDQVIIGVRNFQEIWIIDHSTTIEEAASSNGGDYKKGGDLLYRWGNPKAYKRGGDADRKLFYQHDVQWATEFVSSSSNYYNKVLLYNNFIAEGLSLGQILSPVWNADDLCYQKDENDLFLPKYFEYEFSHPDTLKGYSTSASSIQVLPNDNILMCAARQGRSFEINNEGEVVWEYITPIINGSPAPQGTVANISTNFTFQMERYPIDFEGFENKDMSPKQFLELDPSFELCSLVANNEIDFQQGLFNIEILNVQKENVLLRTKIKTLLSIYDLGGKLLQKEHLHKGDNYISLINKISGIYILHDSEFNQIQKILVNQ